MGLESKDSALSWICFHHKSLCSSGCDGAIIRLQMEVGGEEENAEERLGNVGAQVSKCPRSVGMEEKMQPEK